MTHSSCFELKIHDVFCHQIHTRIHQRDLHELSLSLNVKITCVNRECMCIIEEKKGKTKALTEEGGKGKGKREGGMCAIQLLTNSIGQKRLGANNRSILLSRKEGLMYLPPLRGRGVGREIILKREREINKAS